LTIEDVDINEFPDNARDHIFYIGLRNLLMDAHASVTKEAIKGEEDKKHWSGEQVTAEVKKQSLATAEKKLEALKKGEIRVQGTRTSSLDPVGVEMRRIAIRLVSKELQKAGKKLNTIKSDEMTKLVEAKLETSGDKIRVVAAKFVEDRKALEGL
jgi:hypothetical protein